MTALVGTAGALATGTTTVTPAWGSGQARNAGNLLTCLVTSQGANTIGTPAGWAKVGAADVVNGNSHTAVLWKVASGADAAPAVTGGATRIAAQVDEWSDVHGWPANPLDVSGSRVDTTVVATSTVTASPNPTQAGALVVAVLHWATTGGGHSWTDSRSGVNVSGLAGLSSDTSTNGVDHHQAAWGTVSAAGATTSVTTTSNNFTGTWADLLAVLKPNPSIMARSGGDGAAEVDTAVRQAAADSRAVTDVVVEAEQATRQAFRVRVGADSAQAADTGHTTGRPDFAADSAEAADGPSPYVNPARLGADSAQTADEAHLAREGVHAVDTVVEVEGVARTEVVARSAADDEAAFTTAGQAVAAVRSGADDTAAAESATVEALSVRQVVDDTAAADTGVRVTLAARIVAEDTAEAETATVVILATRQVVDDQAVADTVGTIGVAERIISDDTAEADTDARLGVADRILSDDQATADTVERVAVAVRNLAEDIILLTTAAGVDPSEREPIDTAAFADVATAAYVGMPAPTKWTVGPPFTRWQVGQPEARWLVGTPTP